MCPITALPNWRHLELGRAPSLTISCESEEPGAGRCHDGQGRDGKGRVIMSYHGSLSTGLRLQFYAMAWMEVQWHRVRQVQWLPSQVKSGITEQPPKRHLNYPAAVALRSRVTNEDGRPFCRRRRRRCWIYGAIRVVCVEPVRQSRRQPRVRRGSARPFHSILL